MGDTVDGGRLTPLRFPIMNIIGAIQGSARCPVSREGLERTR